MTNENRTIAMDGAAWLASSVAASADADAFVAAEMKGYAFAHHPAEVRQKMLRQVYALATGGDIPIEKPKKKKTQQQ